MNNLKQELNKAYDLINDSHRFIPKYHDFDKIYPFSNENLIQVYQSIDLKNSDILCIQGSSDQILDICLQGAQNITSFDINPLTIHYFHLKKAALLANITLHEYFLFFCYRHPIEHNHLNKQSFNGTTFDKIKPYLEKESFIFWNNLYSKYHNYEIRGGNGLFNYYEEMPVTILSQTINYLSSEYQFNKLKEKINNLQLQFLNTNITNLPNQLTKKYDLMYLSNIIQYFQQLFSDNLCDKEHNLKKLQLFKELIITLSYYLKDNGQIVNYLYNIQKENANNILYQSAIRNQVFDQEEFQYQVFTSITELKQRNYRHSKTNYQDASLIYTKH